MVIPIIYMIILVSLSTLKIADDLLTVGQVKILADSKRYTLTK